MRYYHLSLILMAFLFLLLPGFFPTARDSFALDAPHDATNNYTCVSQCHTSLTTPWKTQPTGTPTIDDTLTNHLCLSCHNPGYGMGAEAGDVQTHSSFRTSYTYGTWSMECRVCHNPHYQRQVVTYPTSTLNTLATGTIVSVAGTNDSITVSTSLTPSAYIDYVLVPNTAYPSTL
jgi:hypothetical protein